MYPEHSQEDSQSISLLRQEADKRCHDLKIIEPKFLLLALPLQADTASTCQKKKSCAEIIWVKNDCKCRQHLCVYAVSLQGKSVSSDRRTLAI